MFKLKQGMVLFFIAGCICCAMNSPTQADGKRSLFKGLFSTKEKVEANPKSDYTIDETNGPWMIYVKCYDGATAREDAHELALELRQKYRLKAYVYHNKFDHAEEEDESLKKEREFRETLAQSGMQEMPLVIPRFKQQKFVGGRVSEEYAVLVGDFQSINDKDIDHAFQKIKGLEPDCIIAQMKRDIAEANRTGNFDKTMSIEITRMGYREHNNNVVRPLAKAFKCTNPILPPEYFTNRVDNFVQQLNEKSQFSLLRCPGKYTVKVGEFRGYVIADPKGIAEAEKNAKKLHEADKLAQAGDKAENLCVKLREKGIESYTFHDRTKSIVTIGSFASLGKKDQNGEIVEYHPDIVNIYTTFAWDEKKDGVLKRSRPDEPFKVGKSIDNIELLPHPEPMEVPRPFIDYNRR